MSRLKVCTAIILRAIDIGEADRFCVLLTREHGRIAARARSARKPQSRMGALLTGHKSVIELSEHSSGLYIQRVVEQVSSVGHTNVHAFLRLQQGTELLLQLLDDNEPVPEVFDLMSAFLSLCTEEDIDSVSVFTLRLLHLLGYLPTHDDDRRFQSLSPEDQGVIRMCTDAYAWPRVAEQHCSNDIKTFIKVVLAEQLRSPLRATPATLTTTSVDSVARYVETGE